MTTPPKKPLGDQIRDYYLGSSLPEKRVRAILGQAGDSGSASGRFGWVIGLAAILVAALAGGLLLRSPGDPSREVAAEVISNYDKGIKKLIHVTDRYEELASMLFELEFPIADLETVIPPDFDLEGGRYCSLQGQKSALIRLRRRSDGHTAILYVAPRHGILARVGKETVDVGDFEVDLWHDRRRVFALTFEPTPLKGDPHGSAAAARIGVCSLRPGPGEAFEL